MSTRRRFIQQIIGLPGDALAAEAPAWKPALPGYSFEFPRDHGSHPDHKVEWWYYTGNLDASSARRFGYQLTFFRIGSNPAPPNVSAWAIRDVWMAHFAITDIQGGRYHHADRLNRSGPGLAGAAEDTLRVWNEDWSAVLDTDGQTMRLIASDPGMRIDLLLQPGAKPPVIHGENGISQKGTTPGNASHYYSLTRMPTHGTVQLGDERFEVRGASWMDHEFGTSFLESGQQGWDWFSAQLDDGTELMLFQIRSLEGGATQMSGTLIDKDGTTHPLHAGDFALEASKPWRSPASGAPYPLRWQIRLKRHGLELTAAAALPDQEMRAGLTPGLGYWEGAVDYSGTRNGRPLKGRGYLEMTGYSGRSMSAWFGADPKNLR